MKKKDEEDQVKPKVEEPKDEPKKKEEIENKVNRCLINLV